MVEATPTVTTAICNASPDDTHTAGLSTLSQVRRRQVCLKSQMHKAIEPVAHLDQQACSLFHKTQEHFCQDTRVIAQRLLYFGNGLG